MNHYPSAVKRCIIGRSTRRSAAARASDPGPRSGIQ
jgi:hypothetical protein